MSFIRGQYIRKRYVSKYSTDKSTFINQGENEIVGILTTNKEKFRIMTYNVHGLDIEMKRAEHPKESMDEIKKNIADIDPDILCLQEYRSGIDDDYYPYSVFCRSEGRYQNVIFSKYEIIIGIPKFI